MIIYPVAVTMTAVLCIVCSAIGILVTAVVCCCIMKKKKKGIRQGGKHVTPKAEPVYNTPQVSGESSADNDLELKGNTCYTSKLSAL